MIGLSDLERIKTTLHSAVLSDVLDALGRRGQAMRPFVRPLDESVVVCGFARTGLFEPRDGVAKGENPYDVEIALIDDLRPGDVPVLACGGPTETVAPWGELLTNAALARGAVGAITDGLARDARAIRALKFPVFAGGLRPLDSAGRAKMVQRDAAVECAGVRVEPGDLVFGDADGVVVVPRGLIERAVEAAMAKLKAEDRTREEVKAGAKLADVFARHGVL